MSIVWDISATHPHQCNKAVVHSDGGAHKVLEYYHNDRSLASFKYPNTEINFASHLVGYDNLRFLRNWGKGMPKESNDDKLCAVFRGKRAVGKSGPVGQFEALQWKRRVEGENRNSERRYGCYIGSGKQRVGSA